MRWEYKIVFMVSDESDEDAYEQRLHESMNTLNHLGSEGWELAGILPHATAAKLKKYHALFKREKTD
jgi:hypothetical protein